MAVFAASDSPGLGIGVELGDDAGPFLSGQVFTAWLFVGVGVVDNTSKTRRSRSWISAGEIRCTGDEIRGMSMLKFAA